VKILLTGATGQVGGELATQLGAHGDVIALGRKALDLASPDAIVAVLRAAAPDIIVNAAAYTAVDLRLMWRVRDGVDVSLVARNAFDPGHVEYRAGTPTSEIPRSVLLGVRWLLP